jgi:hypothetical protein
VYVGHHTRASKRFSGRKLLSITLFVVVSLALLAPTALGSGRPKSCTGVPATAITIQQTFVSSDASATAGFTYLLSAGTAFDPNAVVASTTLTVGAGQTVSIVLNGFSKGSYSVRQVPDPSSGIAPAPDQSVTISPPACVATVAFTSIVEPS